MKMENFFHSMESSFHPCTDQALFSTSEETEITHLLSTYMNKHMRTKNKPRKPAPAIHYLKGQNYSVFLNMKYAHRDACIRKKAHDGGCAHLTSRTGSNVQLFRFLFEEYKENFTAILVCSIPEIHGMLSVQSSNILKYYQSAN